MHKTLQLQARVLIRHFCLRYNRLIRMHVCTYVCVCAWMHITKKTKVDFGFIWRILACSNAKYMFLRKWNE